MLSMLQSGPETTGTPGAERGKNRLGVVIVLVAMLLLAYLTIAILRPTLLSPTQGKSPPDKSEHLDR